MTVISTLDRAQSLKQQLLDFIFDAEGELAEALEKYSAEQLSQFLNSPYQGHQKTDQVLNSFAVDGTVGSRSVLDLFLESRSDLSAADRALVASWQQGFMGLFTVIEPEPNGLKLMNWLTQKQYRVLLSIPVEQNIARLKPEEIMLTRLLPVGNDWMLSGPAVLLGKLGKPKLAVAIGNFKKYHRDYLYGDAPELLEEAWQSVEVYYQSFVDYFGSNEITLPGHQLEKKLTAFQAHLAQERLTAAGLDGEKSLKELAEEAGTSQEEMNETAAAMGLEVKSTARLLNEQKVSKMMTLSIELPVHLKTAEQVTMLTHPRWGQVVVATYQPLIAELEKKEEEPSASESLTSQCLKNLEIKPFVWHQLAQTYPEELEQALQSALDRPELTLEKDLEQILVNFGHPEQPELPETANVPVHLHNLFQEAMLSTQKLKSSKSKDRDKLKKKTGFG
jgi:hypothetical protein